MSLDCRTLGLNKVVTRKAYESKLDDSDSKALSLSRVVTCKAYGNRQGDGRLRENDNMFGNSLW